VAVAVAGPVGVGLAGKVAVALGRRVALGVAEGRGVRVGVGVGVGDLRPQAASSTPAVPLKAICKKRRRVQGWLWEDGWVCSGIV